MNAVRISACFFPCGIALSVAGVIIVCDEADAAFFERRDEFSDEVALCCAPGEEFIEERMRHCEIFFRMSEREDAVPRPGAVESSRELFRVEEIDGVLIGQFCSVLHDGVRRPVHADSEVSAHPRGVDSLIIHNKISCFSE